MNAIVTIDGRIVGSMNAAARGRLGLLGKAVLEPVRTRRRLSRMRGISDTDDLACDGGATHGHRVGRRLIGPPLATASGEYRRDGDGTFRGLDRVPF